MRLYVFLILLPAAALAVCDNDAIWKFFALVDGNKDDKIDHQEAYGLINKADTNNDTLVTLPEFKDAVNVLAPELKDHEQALLDFLDDDQDGSISKSDVEADFNKIDKDGDKMKSKSEYQQYLDQICPTEQTIDEGDK